MNNGKTNLPVVRDSERAIDLVQKHKSQQALVFVAEEVTKAERYTPLTYTEAHNLYEFSGPSCLEISRSLPRHIVFEDCA